MNHSCESFVMNHELVMSFALSFRFDLSSYSDKNAATQLFDNGS